MIDTTKCPRCNIPLSDYIGYAGHCQKCGIKYNGNNMRFYGWVGKYRVYWYMDYDETYVEHCYVDYDFSPFSPDLEQQIPALPFDITEERLEKLLLLM